MEDTKVVILAEICLAAIPLVRYIARIGIPSNDKGFLQQRFIREDCELFNQILSPFWGIHHSDASEYRFKINSEKRFETPEEAVEFGIAEFNKAYKREPEYVNGAAFMTI